MAKLIPFPTRYLREATAYLLALSVRLERFSRHHPPWTRPQANPERFGNNLQRLVHEWPAGAYVIDHAVAEMIAYVDSGQLINEN